MQAHLAQGDKDHKGWGYEQEDGGRGGWLRRLRRAAEVGSPAYFFNTVLYQDNARKQQLEAGLKSYRAAVAHRAAQGEAPQRPAAAPRVADDEGDPRTWGLLPVPRRSATEIKLDHDLAWIDYFDTGMIARLMHGGELTCVVSSPGCHYVLRLGG